MHPVCHADLPGLLEKLSVPRLIPGLRRLLRGYDRARETGRDIWEFAVAVGELREDGLGDPELYWLVCAGLAASPTGPLTAGREQSPTANRMLRGESRMVLTGLGADLARLVVVADRSASGGEILGKIRRPAWDRHRRELRVGAVVVKHFRQPAPNQELILEAFEEEGWPAYIYDPLPPAGGTCPKDRLHETIKGLNRSQQSPLIRFRGDGTGTRVGWEYRGKSSPTAPPTPSPLLEG